MYQKRKREGNIRKGGGPGGEDSLTGGLSGALNRVRAWKGAEAEGERQNTLPVSGPLMPCDYH